MGKPTKISVLGIHSWSVMACSKAVSRNINIQLTDSSGAYRQHSQVARFSIPIAAPHMAFHLQQDRKTLLMCSSHERKCHGDALSLYSKHVSLHGLTCPKR